MCECWTHELHNEGAIIKCCVRLDVDERVHVGYLFVELDELIDLAAPERDLVQADLF